LRGKLPARILRQVGSAQIARGLADAGRTAMRIMVKFSLPVEAGNAAIRSGKLEKVMHQIVDELKPEAAYFFPTGGERGGFFVVEMQDSSQIVETAERLFFGLNAKVDLVPVMSAADLEKGLSSVQGTIQRYG
jgi:hypothetical protein